MQTLGWVSDPTMLRSLYQEAVAHNFNTTAPNNSTPTTGAHATSSTSSQVPKPSSSLSQPNSLRNSFDFDTKSIHGNNSVAGGSGKQLLQQQQGHNYDLSNTGQNNTRLRARSGSGNSIHGSGSYPILPTSSMTDPYATSYTATSHATHTTTTPNSPPFWSSDNPPQPPPPMGHNSNPSAPPGFSSSVYGSSVYGNMMRQ